MRWFDVTAPGSHSSRDAWHQGSYQPGAGNSPVFQSTTWPLPLLRHRHAAGPGSQTMSSQALTDKHLELGEMLGAAAGTQRGLAGASGLGADGEAEAGASGVLVLPAWSKERGGKDAGLRVGQLVQLIAAYLKEAPPSPKTTTQLGLALCQLLEHKQLHQVSFVQYPSRVPHMQGSWVLLRSTYTVRARRRLESACISRQLS